MTEINNIVHHFVVLVLILFILTPLTIISQEKQKNMNSCGCDVWVGCIDREINRLVSENKKDSCIKFMSYLTFMNLRPIKGFVVDTTYTEEQVMQAIECLLKCKGNKKPAGIGGVTSLYISQYIPPTTVEVAALFYISYLYKANYTHASGIQLVGGGENQIEKAYASYEKWFKKVKEIGLSKARELKLEPLEGSGVDWY